eukprot:m.147234 g.147234  ORF g.147234 m.147234 type:complete len:488 (-) comp30522_c0_seq4:286-1749(-)
MERSRKRARNREDPYKKSYHKTQSHGNTGEELVDAKLDVKTPGAIVEALEIDDRDWRRPENMRRRNDQIPKPFKFAYATPPSWPSGGANFTQCNVWKSWDMNTFRTRLLALQQKTVSWTFNSDSIDPTFNPYVELHRTCAQQDAQTVIVAKRSVETHQLLGQYSGVVRERRDVALSSATVVAFMTSEGMNKRGLRCHTDLEYFIDATDLGNEFRFVELTDDENMANVRLDPGVCECGKAEPVCNLLVVACRNIKKGERLVRFVPDLESILGLAVYAKIESTSATRVKRPQQDDVTAKEYMHRHHAHVEYSQINQWQVDQTREVRLAMSSTTPLQGVKIEKIFALDNPCRGERGLFATTAFAKWEAIGRCSGEVMPLRLANEFYADSLYNFHHHPQDVVVDMMRFGNELGFANDGVFGYDEDRTNCKIYNTGCKIMCHCGKGEPFASVFIQATKEIEIGQELLISYGQEYWENVNLAASGNDSDDSTS